MFAPCFAVYLSVYLKCFSSPPFTYFLQVGKPEAGVKGTGLSAPAAKTLLRRFRSVRGILEAAEAGLIDGHLRIVQRSAGLTAQAGRAAPGGATTKMSGGGDGGGAEAIAKLRRAERNLLVTRIACDMESMALQPSEIPPGDGAAVGLGDLLGPAILSPLGAEGVAYGGLQDIGGDGLWDILREREEGLHSLSDHDRAGVSPAHHGRERGGIVTPLDRDWLIAASHPHQVGLRVTTGVTIGLSMGITTGVTTGLCYCFTKEIGGSQVSHFIPCIPVHCSMCEPKHPVHLILLNPSHQ